MTVSVDTAQLITHKKREGFRRSRSGPIIFWSAQKERGVDIGGGGRKKRIWGWGRRARRGAVRQLSHPTTRRNLRLGRGHLKHVFRADAAHSGGVGVAAAQQPGRPLRLQD